MQISVFTLYLIPHNKMKTTFQIINYFIILYKKFKFIILLTTHINNNNNSADYTILSI